MSLAPDILARTSAEYIATAATRGMSRSEAIATYRAVHRDGEAIDIAPIGQVHDEFGTVKFTQVIEDGLETESVILPIESRTGRPRITLCVSSQVGCAMGCTFCETAQMGFIRNLTTEQIVGQRHAARFEFNVPISNIVFMGMGEPMDNVDAVIQAIRVLVDDNGPAIPASRVTVSTVGRVEGIRRLAALASEPGFGRLALAVSVNAPNDEIRSSIMPLNRSTPMGELMEAMRAWPLGKRGRILIEYVLIPGVNDHPDHARELCRYLAPLPCTVNIIPYNPRRDSPWPAPDEADVDTFVALIAAEGQFVKRRQTMGRSIMGACGQLGSAAIRRRQRVTVSRPAR